jgi:hypothetical protein
VTALDERLNRLRPLPENTWSALTRLFAAEDVRFTWASNALEGNTLTLRETQRVLEDGATIAGKSMRDHLEAVNHAAAVRRMHELADGGEAITVQVMPRSPARAIARRMRTLRQPEWTSRSPGTPSAKTASIRPSPRRTCTMRLRACIRLRWQRAHHADSDERTPIRRLASNPTGGAPI